MINRMTRIAAAACLCAAGFTQVSRADQWDKRTVLTVNQPIQVPGKTLPPGTYVMKLLESSSNRHIVQVFNERQNHLETTILAIPNYRLQPTGKTQFAWWETPAGQPPALRAWFYPGDNFGQEFAYPKGAFMQVASSNVTNVPAVPTTPPQQSEATAETVVTTPAVTESPAQEAPVEIAQNSAPEPAPAASPAPVAPSVPDKPAPQPTLPASASAFPLYGLVGLGALTAGFLIRRSAAAHS